MALSLLGTYNPPTHEALAERALRNPASTVWLDHVCVLTAHFERSVAFYVGVLGLTLRTIEAHPLFPTRLRALLIDAEGRDIIELLESETQEGCERRRASRQIIGQVGFPAAVPLMAPVARPARLSRHPAQGGCRALVYPGCRRRGPQNCPPSPACS